MKKVFLVWAVFSTLLGIMIFLSMPKQQAFADQPRFGRVKTATPTMTQTKTATPTPTVTQTFTPTPNATNVVAYKDGSGKNTYSNGEWDKVTGLSLLLGNVAYIEDINGTSTFFNANGVKVGKDASNYVGTIGPNAVVQGSSGIVVQTGSNAVIGVNTGGEIQLQAGDITINTTPTVASSTVTLLNSQSTPVVFSVKNGLITALQ